MIELPWPQAIAVLVATGVVVSVIVYLVVLLLATFRKDK